MDSKIYLATLVHKSIVGEEEYLFYSMWGMIGTYDEQRDMFISRENKEYPRMENLKFLRSSKKSAFANLISLAEFKKYFHEEKSIEDLFRFFHKMYQKVSFFIPVENDVPLVMRYDEELLEKSFTEEELKVIYEFRKKEKQSHEKIHKITIKE